MTLEQTRDARRYPECTQDFYTYVGDAEVRRPSNTPRTPKRHSGGAQEFLRTLEPKPYIYKILNIYMYIHAYA